MYLSVLQLNPEHRRSLISEYRLHQRLCMAFPTLSRFQRDPRFIEAYVPQDFDEFRVPRNEESNFLFRRDGSTVLVQSGTKPNWDYAFRNALFLLHAHRVRERVLDFRNGQHLQFSLRANPTVKMHVEGESHRPKNLAIFGAEKQVEWLRNKGEHGGFVVGDVTVEDERWVKEKKRDQLMTHLSVHFCGTLRVQDVERFRATVIRGIGRGKGVGFGLLLTRPV